MRVRRLAGVAVVVVSASGLAAVVPVSPAAANGPVAIRTRMVSAAWDGEPGDGQSGTGHPEPDLGEHGSSPFIGSDGDRRVSTFGQFVVFHSFAKNLAPGSAPSASGNPDVFVKDLRSGFVTQVSVGSGGAAPDGLSMDPAISGDGRFVVFASTATNLVPSAGNSSGRWRVYRHDRDTRSTDLVSINLADDVDAVSPSISDDGQYVTYSTRLWPVVRGDGEVQLRDMAGTTTTQVGPTDRASSQPIISGNGRYVAYASETFAHPVLDGHPQVYRWDRQTGTSELISVHADGSSDDDCLCSEPSISRDGTEIAFSSFADLGAGARSQVYVRDLNQPSGPATLPISLNSAEVPGSGYGPSISPNGAFVAFRSGNPHLVPGDTNEADDVFVRDRQRGTTARASVSAAGAQSDHGRDSFEPSLNANGDLVVYDSEAENLVLDGNAATDVFIGPANGVQAPAAPLTITDLRCHSRLMCVLSYTGGAQPARIVWTVNGNRIPAARNQNWINLRCNPYFAIQLSIRAEITDDLHSTASRTVSPWCFP